MGRGKFADIQFTLGPCSRISAPRNELSQINKSINNISPEFFYKNYKVCVKAIFTKTQKSECQNRTLLHG